MIDYQAVNALMISVVTASAGLFYAAVALFVTQATGRGWAGFLWPIAAPAWLVYRLARWLLRAKPPRAYARERIGLKDV